MQNECIKYITFFSTSKLDKNNLIRKRKAVAYVINYSTQTLRMNMFGEH